MAGDAVSVYVDNARLPFGNMVMCHMLADTPAELKAMAEKIGVQLRWFQYKASAPHFDICLSKRKRAIEAGAVELLDRQAFCDKMAEVRASWPRDGKRWLLP